MPCGWDSGIDRSITKIRPPSSFPARCLLAALSGAVYALAYPPLGWGWLVVPGIVGLLVALRDQHGTRARAIGLLHGMVAYGVGLSWLFQIFGPLVVMLWCVLAAFTALFAGLQSRAVLRGIGGWRLWVFTALNWCGWEFIRAEIFPLKFPWMTVGLAVGPNAVLPWVGVYGVSVIAVLLATGIAMRKWKTACGLSLPLLCSVVWLRSLPEPAADDVGAVKVAGIQLEAVMFDDFLKATQQLPTDVQHVVWPEYALPYDVRADPREWSLLLELCRERGITMTIGTQARPTGSDDWRNIALTLDAEGVHGEHTKVHTVHFFDDGIRGKTALPVETAFGKTGTPICFDCDYEGVVRNMTAAGAEMFIVPVMDAKSWTARQHEQHAALFRIRACENGRWMFVCATSGVSQLIDPHGMVHDRLPVLEQGTLIGRIRPETKLTFYTHYGWLTPWCVLVVAAVCWIILLLPNRKRPSGT